MKKLLPKWFNSWFLSSKSSRLKQLESKALKDLQLLDYPPRHNWIPPRKTTSGEKIYDVVIVEGGQTGMALALALMREKVTNLIIFDESQRGNEGPWLTYARMETLRTPKYTLGPDCDIPGLTFQAWYEAVYGEEAWRKINFIPRKDWAAYLQWLRTFLKLPIVNNVHVGPIQWVEKEKCFLVPVPSQNPKEVYARKVILATGLQGSGEWTVPEHIRQNIPEHYFMKQVKTLTLFKVNGKKVGILGGGPCAFDNALMAVIMVQMKSICFFKKPKLVNLHVFLCGEYSGFLKIIGSLPDSNKWRVSLPKCIEIGQPPTPPGVRQSQGEQKHLNPL